MQVVLPVCAILSLFLFLLFFFSLPLLLSLSWQLAPLSFYSPRDTDKSISESNTPGDKRKKKGYLIEKEEKDEKKKKKKIEDEVGNEGKDSNII